MREFGLIGYPLTHSFSKNYFTQKFTEEEIKDCSYENFQLQSVDQLWQILDEHPDLEGLNVTIPYKQVVIPFLDHSTPVVEEIGACNCIRVSGGTLSGYNTDVIGFEKSLLSNSPLRHKK